MINLPDSFSANRSRHIFARSQALRRSWPFVLDLGVAGLGLACFYGLMQIAKYWFGHPEPEIAISPMLCPCTPFIRSSASDSRTCSASSSRSATDTSPPTAIAWNPS